MKRLRQFEPFILSDFELDEYPLPRHNHTYHQIIYIVHGGGRHCLNKRNFDYRQGDLFLLTPEDNHYFVVTERTRFVFLKFTAGFLYNQPHTSPGYFDHEVEPVMRNKYLQEMKPELAAADQPSLQRSNEQLLSFIHQPIYSPEYIQIKHVAHQFKFLRGISALISGGISGSVTASISTVTASALLKDGCRAVSLRSRKLRRNSACLMKVSSPAILKTSGRSVRVYSVGNSAPSRQPEATGGHKTVSLKTLFDKGSVDEAQQRLERFERGQGSR